MRLICPNCGAQYEVPDDVIPQDGRDVQCSNCGVTWFQDPNKPDPELSDDDMQDSWQEEPEEQASAEADEFIAPQEAEPEPQSADFEDNVADDSHEDVASNDDDRDHDSEPPAAPQRRELDPSIADVLRQEAEHEAQVRANEAAGGLESQPDLGLTEPSDEAAQRERDARNRMARLRGEPEPENVQMAANASRRDLLPDIEEINSTLRSASDRREPQNADGSPAPAVVRRKRRSFRRGFMFMLLLAIVLFLVYIFAPKIAEAIPALQGVMDGYVSQVDALRGALDTQIAKLMLWLDNAAASSGDGGT